MDYTNYNIYVYITTIINYNIIRIRISYTTQPPRHFPKTRRGLHDLRGVRGGLEEVGEDVGVIGRPKVLTAAAKRMEKNMEKMP